MNPHIAAVKNTLRAMKDVESMTDRAMAELNEMNERYKNEAKAVYQQWHDHQITYDEYDRRMKEILSKQKEEGDAIEAAYLKVTRTKP